MNSKNIISRTLDFGKIACFGTRKINRITVDVELKDGQNLSISGHIWNSTQTDSISAGQNHDEINKHLQGNRLWDDLHYLWTRWHLNDMHAGTPEQEAITDQLKRYDYDLACKLLKSDGLYIVPAEQADPYRRHDTDKGRPYTYGHEWLVWPIPDDILRAIQYLITTGSSIGLHQAVKNHRTRTPRSTPTPLPGCSRQL